MSASLQVIDFQEDIMDRRVFLGLAGLAAMDGRLVAQQGAAAHAQGAPAERDDAALQQAEKNRFAAMVKADVAALDKMLASELSYTHGDARVVDKNVFLAELKAGDFKYLTIQPADIQVRVYGDSAVVTGGAAMDIVNKGVPATIRIRYTNMQVRRSGSWQMVAWQATRLA
jgi:hypothetical protein